MDGKAETLFPRLLLQLQPLALFISFSEILLILSNANTSVLIHWTGTHWFSELSWLFMEERALVLLESEDKGAVINQD